MEPSERPALEKMIDERGFRQWSHLGIVRADGAKERRTQARIGQIDLKMILLFEPPDVLIDAVDTGDKERGLLSTAEQN